MSRVDCESEFARFNVSVWNAPDWKERTTCFTLMTEAEAEFKRLKLANHSYGELNRLLGMSEDHVTMHTFGDPQED